MDRQLRLRWVNDGVHDFTLRDLLVLVKNLPRGAAVFRAMHGDEEAKWGVSEHLLAMIAENTAWLVWSKTKDAEKGRNKPRQIPRPGVEDEATETIGKDVLPMADMIEFLGDGYAVLLK